MSLFSDIQIFINKMNLIIQFMRSTNARWKKLKFPIILTGAILISLISNSLNKIYFLLSGSEEFNNLKKWERLKKDY